MTERMVKRLERRIDDLVEERPLPQVFIVPGANPASAAIDVARAVIRRAERNVVALEHAQREVNPEVRGGTSTASSDLLFVLARWQAGEASRRAADSAIASGSIRRRRRARPRCPRA